MPGEWEREAGKNPAASPALRAPHTLRDLGLIQDSGQHSRTVRKGWPCKGEAGYLYQSLQEGMGWIFCPFLQNPSPNSVTIGINLFLKERPGSVTILLEALEKSLSLSWPQGPPLRREMGHVCAASLLASVHGPNETFCIKIFRKK